MIHVVRCAALGAIVTLSLLQVGCPVVAVGAGVAVGTAGALAYTDRGAKSDVNGDVRDVRRRAEHVFREMGIEQTESATKKGGAEHELKGAGPGEQVTVRIASTGSGLSHVEVEASRGTFQWDKEYARQVLQKIIQRPS